MLDTNKYEQYGFQRSQEDIKGITIHETNNEKMSARQLFDFLNNENKSSQGTHYIIDDTEVIEVMPLDWAVYHTGKGIDYGCRHTIAIEIVSSLSDDKFNEAKNKAIELIITLMKRCHLTTDDIFFHNFWNSRAFCPKTLIRQYGTGKNFAIEELEEN